MKQLKSLKSLYDETGYTLTQDGLNASKQIETVLSQIYKELLDKGYSPSECRKLILTQTWIVTTFENAMRSCE